MKIKHLVTLSLIVLLALIFWYIAANKALPKNTVIQNTRTSSSSAQLSGNSSCVENNGLPDRNCTPGAVAETDANVVCHRSTKTIRPSVSYTNSLKLKQIASYGYSDTSPANYEEDHLIPLELGGDPTSEQNLWPEPRNGSHPASEKDKIENLLHARVCSGQTSLDEAQKAISTNWELVQ